MGPISGPSGLPLRLSSLTEDTWMITVSSCGVKLQEVLSGLEKERLKHYTYTCTFVAFLNITFITLLFFILGCNYTFLMLISVTVRPKPKILGATSFPELETASV